MKTKWSGALLAACIVAAAAPAVALPSCTDGARKMDEARALRIQAREELRVGDHDRACDTFEEARDSVDDAQDAFRDCGELATAVELRGALRSLRMDKRINDC